MAEKPKYWSKLANNGQRNNLFVITKRHTFHIGWIDHGSGPIVYSIDRYMGKIGNLSERGYIEMNIDMAAAILAIAINDLCNALPTKINS